MVIGRIRRRRGKCTRRSRSGKRMGRGKGTGRTTGRNRTRWDRKFVINIRKQGETGREG